MATFGFDLEFKTDERYVEGFFTVDPQPLDESVRPIVTLSENGVNDEVTEILARYRPVTVGGDAGPSVKLGLGVVIRTSQPSKVNANMCFSLFLEGAGWSVRRISDCDGGISRTSG